MKLQGNYVSANPYLVGDIVRYTDGVWYHLQKAAPAGTPPTDTRYWGRKDPSQNEMLSLIMDVIEMIPTNYEEEEVVDVEPAG